MADFEETIVAEIGIEALGSVLYAPAYPVVEAGVGVGVSVDYEYIPRGSVVWNQALEDNNNDPAKAAESLQSNLDYYTLKKVSAEKKILQIEALSLQERAGEIANLAEFGHEAQIWCADLTQDLSGDVGIIEVPGEQTARNIQPGYNANAVYSGSRDGQILPAIVSTPAATFWNLAMLPGWQKWKPTYRYGTITWISGDNCSVTLEAATSSQQNIDVNQATTLANVPIEYMQCNGAAFAVDDVVLIEFTGQDFSTPKVIGFKDHPQPCGARWVVFKCWAEDPGSPPTTYDAHYVVWDAQNAQLADLSAWSGPTVPGDYPCSEADLAAWVAATTEIEDTACYGWVADGESTPSNDISANDGCGELTNIEDEPSPVFAGIDCPDWNEELDGYASYNYFWSKDWFFPAYLGVLASQGGSYNLEIVAGLEGEGETTCFRLEYTYDSDYAEFLPCPAADPWNPTKTWDQDYMYRRSCLLGWLDTYQWMNQEVGGCSAFGPELNFPWVQTLWEEYDTYFTGKSPENRNVNSQARYSGTIMVQCYVFQAAGQYKERQNALSCNPAGWGAWAYQGSPARLTDAKIAVNYHAGDITGTNPKDQVSIPALEAKVEEAMDAAADEAGEGDKRCIDYFEMKMRI